MSRLITLRRTATPGKIPTIADLQLGELAMNTYDGKVYLKKNVNGVETIVTLGETGGTGAQGAQGASGPSGGPGPLGPQGSVGDPGPQGFQGSTGNQGEIGPQGIQGSIGNQGLQGIQGSIGPQGALGPQGNQGPQGIQGIKGDKGDQGFNGVDGAQGRQGPQGNQGPQGIQGVKGDQGNQGPTGLQGNQGPLGFQGSQGNQGSQGPQGVQGHQGSGGISAGQVYYFNQSQSSDVSPYKVLSIEPTSTTQQITSVTTNGSNPILISQFLTPQLGFSVIPSGVQRFHLHYLRESQGNNIDTYVTIQLANSSGTAIGPLITSGVAAVGWLDSINTIETLVDIVLPSTVVNPTNRMIVKIYVIDQSNGSHNIAWYTEGSSSYSYVLTSVGATVGSQGPQGAQGSDGYIGADGAQGAQGAKGDQGFQGSFGLQGYQGFGYQGNQGFQGGFGLQGFQGGFGLQGFQGFGFQGNQGFQGGFGLQGFQGGFGLQGNQGPTGLQGTTGAQGNQGPTGLQGTIGAQGNQGPTGLQGTNGAQGNQGPTGSQGSTGAQGASIAITSANNTIVYKNSSGIVTGSTGLQYDGVSIKVNGNLESVYSNGDEGGEIFLSKSQTNTTLTNGVTIDVYQNRLRIFENGGGVRGGYFDISSLSPGVSTNLLAGGSQGATGAQGATGPQGNQGPTGSQGNQGPIGAQGNQGPKGDKGDQGFTGQQGHQGPNGPQGTTGAQGNQGPTGLQGTAGTNGTNGTNGAQGNQGPTGLQGAAGTNGTNGTNGAQGATGPQGAQGAQGALGAQGAAGTNGTNGAQGLQGTTGAASTVAGPQGATGAQGSAGTTSFTATNLQAADATQIRFNNVINNDYSTMTFMSRAWSAVQGANGLAYNFTTHTNAGSGGYGAFQIYYGESGYVFSPTSFRSPIFYDSNDTGYYVDPASTSRMNNIILGSAYNPVYQGQLVLGHTSYNFNFLNGTWASSVTAGILANCADEWEFVIHDSGTSVESVFLYQNSTGRLLMGRDIGWGTMSIQAAADFRAPIFYDSNDTSYYLDPNSTSDQALRIRGGTLHGPNPTWGKYLLVGGDGRQNRTDDTNVASVCTTNGNLHLDSASGYTTYINWYDGGEFIFGAGNSSTEIMHGYNNYVVAGGSFRAPIFYDSADTGYYIDPNASGTSSVLNGTIRLEGGAFGTNSRSGSSQATLSRTFAPQGASNGFNGGGITAAIKIRLPFRANDCMWSMKVRIYNYANDQVSEYTMGNYSYSAGSYHRSAYFMGGISATPRTVRFGNDGTYDCVWIGETSTSWSYPQVSVMDFQGGYVRSSVSETANNWNITFVTSFDTVAEAITPSIRFSDVTASSVNAPSGYVSNGNPWGTSNSAYFPNGISTAGGTNWIYGYTYIGNAPSNGAGHEFFTSGSSNSTGDVSAYQSLRAPIFYDRNDTGFYLDPASTSNLNQITAATSARWGRSGMYWTVRPDKNGSSVYWTGTNGWGTDEGNWNNAWKGGFSGWDIWGTSTGHPQGGGYIHAQGIVSGLHYVSGDGGDAYGWMMVGAHNATENRYWLRGKWSTSTSGWVEMITTGNVGSQSVNYASTAGNTNSISSAVGSGYTWTGIQYFLTNNGGYLGSTDSAKLQAYSTGNNSAFMSFHKSGQYAVNFGLDADNVMRIGGWSASANRWQLDMSGNMTVAGDVTAYSDARVKTNIQTIKNALDKTLALRGVSYNRTDSDDTKTKIGVIAQETLPIVPEVVNQDNDGMYNVSYGNMAGLFIEAIKELNAKIAHLEAQLASK